MIAAIAIAVVVLAVAAGSFYAGKQLEQNAGDEVLAAVRDRLTDRNEELERTRARVGQLEFTIDEIRARQLETTPPVPTDTTPARVLPAEIEQEISLIEDADGRDEYREQALLILEQFPELEPKDVIERLF